MERACRAIAVEEIAIARLQTAPAWFDRDGVLRYPRRPSYRPACVAGFPHATRVRPEKAGKSEQQKGCSARTDRMVGRSASCPAISGDRVIPVGNEVLSPE